MEIETPSVRPFDPEKVPNSDKFPEFSLPEPPYDIEVGCGVGYHPIQYVNEFPDRTLIAIERTHERFSKFLGRIRGNSVGGNLVPIHSDALIWIVHHIPKASVGRYFFLYPNPFPKNRRWHSMPFMQYVLETLEEDGTITLATNVEEYYQEAKHFFMRHWNLLLEEDRKLSSSEQPRTHFEKKYLERGETCWNLVVAKPVGWKLEDCVAHSPMTQ